MINKTQTKLSNSVKQLNKQLKKSLSISTMAEIYSDIIEDYSQHANELYPFISQLSNEEGSAYAPKPPIKYPVFQGGGVKGNVYVGTYRVLDQQGYLDEIECAGGASAGGIVAFFMAMGFNGEQFKYASDRLNFLDFTDLKEGGWGSYLDGNSVGTYIDLIQHGAAYSGKNFHRWVSYYIEQILGSKYATFKDLHDQRSQDPTLKDLLVTATKYGTDNGVHAQQVFSYETTPNVLIADALRATMAFPGAFAPWEVREKVSSTDPESYTLIPIGFFADGGILNNFPVNCFNSKHYLDQQYSFVEREDHNGIPLQINPCTVGFSLTTLDKLDDNITPLSERTSALVAISKAKGKTDQRQLSERGWHYSDIARSVIWNTFGKRETENVEDKQKIYCDQTVQIWPAGVSTLDFGVSQEKAKRMVENGIEATSLWLQKFRNPKDSYAETDDFVDVLTKKQKRQLAENPKEFYLSHLEQNLIGFFKEMKKAQKQSKDSDTDLLQNIRLRYLSDKITHIVDIASNEKLDILQEASDKAIQAFLKDEKKISQNHQKRWELLDPSKILLNFDDTLAQKPKVGLRILKGQLSNVISLSQHEQGKLLSMIVQNNDVTFAKKAFKVIFKALNHQHVLGKTAKTKDAFSELLNSAEPCLLQIAADLNNHEMLDLLLEHDVSLSDKVNSERKNIFHQIAVDASPCVFSRLVFEAMNAKQGSLLCAKDVYGKTPFSYLVENNRIDIIRELINQGKGKDVGLLWVADLRLEDFFQWKNNAHDLKTALSYAHQSSPTLYKLVLNNLRDGKLADKINNELKLTKTKCEDQPHRVDINLFAIKNEPFMFNQFQRQMIGKALAVQARNDNPLVIHARPSLSA